MKITMDIPKLEVNVTKAVTPEEVADEIFNNFKWEVNAVISDATDCVIQNKDCILALKEAFNNFDNRQKDKWFAEVLKKFIKYLE